jgi:hypothetical protein
MCCLTKSSPVFSLISILFLSSENLSSTSSSVGVTFQCVFCLTKETFYFQDFCFILFSEVFHIFVQLLFLYFVLSSLFHYLSFYSVLCFTLVFVEVFFLSSCSCFLSSQVLYLWCLKIS